MNVLSRFPVFFQLSLFVAMLNLSACSSLSPRDMPEDMPAPAQFPASALSSEAAILAITALDTPYRRGGSSYKGFDCSGLVYFIYRQMGLSVARTAIAQYQQSHRVEKKHLRAGDLVFFRLNSRAVSHVGIYLGDDQFIHAPSTGKRVSYAQLSNPFWKKRYVGGGRFS